MDALFSLSHVRCNGWQRLRSGKIALLYSFFPPVLSPSLAQDIRRVFVYSVHEMNKVAPNERNGAKITANTKAEINTTANKAGRGKTSEKLITRNKRWIREGNKDKKKQGNETKRGEEVRRRGRAPRQSLEARLLRRRLLRETYKLRGRAESLK